MKEIDDILNRPSQRWAAFDEQTDAEVAEAIRLVPDHYATTAGSVASSGFVNPTAVTCNMGATPNNLDNLALIEVSGTFTGITAAIRGSSANDSSGNPIWANVAGLRMDTLALETTPTVSNSTNRIWAVQISGFNQVQLNVTAISTGTLVVNITTSNQDNPAVLGVSIQSALAGNQTIGGTLSVTGLSTLAGISMSDATNIALATTTGTQLGTATTQKLGLWGVTPIVQPTNATDIYTALVNVGIIATGGTPAFSPPGNVNIADAKNIVCATTTGSSFGGATTQKLSFYGVTPVTQPAASSATSVTATTGSSTGVSLDTKFTGTGGTANYTVGGVITALKALGLLAA